jgi:nucleoside diphosphate kinase
VQNAIQQWRQLMGPSHSVAARTTDPLSIRALYGSDGKRAMAATAQE